MYSNFFHVKRIHGEIPCTTSVLRFNRIFHDYKKECRKKNLLPAAVPLFLHFVQLLIFLFLEKFLQRFQERGLVR